MQKFYFKMLHYFVKNFFRSTAVNGYVHNGNVIAFVVTDHPSIEEYYTIHASIFTWKDFRPILNESIVLDIIEKPSVSKKNNSNIYFQIKHIIYASLVIARKSV